MIDKIPIVGDSWVSILIGYSVLVFLYYFIWLAVTMILLNKSTKHAFLYGKRSIAKIVARFIIIFFLIGGLNLSMYALGLYSNPSADELFLFLLSVLFAVMIISMIDIMSSKFSGAEEFYNTSIAFILTIGFLSPTTGLLTLKLNDKLYLLGGLLITSILFSFEFVKNMAGIITDKVTKFFMKNIKTE